MLTADDRLEIFSLYARYSWAVDFGDSDAYAACFAPDAVVLGRSIGEVRGREQISKIPAVNSRHRTKHVTTNMLVEGDGDQASGRAYFVYLTAPIDRGLKVSLSGEYHDRFRRDQGEWLITERRTVYEEGWWDPDSFPPKFDLSEPPMTNLG